MARAFDNASNQYLVNAQAAVTAVPVTMACWFNTDDADSAQALMSISDTIGGVHNYHTLNAQGNVGGDPIRVATKSSVTTQFEAESSTGYSTNTWHHACGIWAAVDDRRAFIDGGSKGTDVNSSTPTGIDETNIGSLTIGTGRVNYTSGSVGEAAMWTAALTDAEVAILALGYSPLFVRPASLVAYWPLIGRTSPEIDIVGGYDMTLNAGPTTAAHPRVIYPQQQLWTPPPLIGGLSRRGIGRGIMRGVGRGV